jgi:hypothetical protein
MIGVMMVVSLSAVWAETVTEEQARSAAEQWLVSSPVLRFALDAEGVELPVVESVSSLALADGATAWHVALSPRGYLIMAADDRLSPVIAFSVTSDLITEKSDENALLRILTLDVTANSDLLRRFDDGGEYPADRDDLQDKMDENRAVWQALQDGEMPAVFVPDALTTNVAPMLSTSWNQTRYYNDYMPGCSGVSAPYNGHAPAGCGSIAAAQIYNFYRWPYRGSGSQSYSDDGTTRSTSLYRVYDWGALYDDYVYSSSYPATSVTAIATLIRDAGYAMEMDYGCSVSASYNQSFADAANRFLFYKQCTSRTWNETLARTELQNGRPLQISYDEGGGHMLVADGLAQDGSYYFHINYGWGGAQDGWYRPASLYGSASIDYMTTGVEPLAMPMFTNAPTTIGETSYTLGWSVADVYTNEIDYFSLYEGVPGASGTFSDNATGLNNWWNEESGWTATSGSFFYCATNAHQGYIQLILPVIPSSSSTLSYSYRRSLATVNHVYIEASANAGQTWTTLGYYKGQVLDSSFKTASHSLAAYNGKPVYLRIRFRHNRGVWGWYGASAATSGFYIDNIQVSNCRQLSLNVLESTISSNQTSYEITNKFAGTYYHYLSMRTREGENSAAPFVSQMTVDLETMAFKAFALTNNAVLRWPSPESCGYPNNTVMVRRAVGAYPTNTSDGAEVCVTTNIMYEDTGLTPGTTYYYTIWCHDGSGFVVPLE